MSSLFGLSEAAKLQLLARVARKPAAPAGPGGGKLAAPPLGRDTVRTELDLIKRAGDALQMPSPFFREHGGVAGASTLIGNAEYDNFSSYNYLGLNGDERVSGAAKAAIDRYGTSVSASRVVSGERPLHRELESELAGVYGVDDCVTMVSGHATNVTTIGHLVDKDDVIFHDSLSHNSIVQGALLSGARRVSFPHNDFDELERLLAASRGRATRALIVIEGHYSMDGDVPDLPRAVALARAWRASLMVDEAHSLGVLGAKGFGIAEMTGVDPRDVDVWMGTLSKTLCGSGGYIAGSQAVVDYVRQSAPGFVYSVGLAPPVAGAALAALRAMKAEPWRVEKVQRNGQVFRDALRAEGLDTGPSVGSAIVPIVVGSSIRAGKLAQFLFEHGVNVQPIIYPAVPEHGARLRFFLSSLHEEAALRRVAALAAEGMRQVAGEKLNLAKLAASLRK